MSNNKKTMPLTLFLMKNFLLIYLFLFFIIVGFQIVLDIKQEENRNLNSLQKVGNTFSTEFGEAILSKKDIKNIALKIKKIVDLNNIIVLDKNDDEIFVLDKLDKIDSLKKNSKTVVEIKLIDDKEHIIGTLLLFPPDLIDFFATNSYDFSLFLIYIIVFFLLSLITYYFSKKYLSKPLLEFSKDLESLSVQDVMPMISLPNSSIDEIHDLEDTANLFIQEIFVLKESYKIIIEELMEKQEIISKENYDLEEEVKHKSVEVLEKEYRFKSIFEDSNVAIVIMSTQGYIVEYNKSYRKLLEFEADELKGVNFSEITHPEDIKQQDMVINELLSGISDTKRLEKRYVTKYNKIIWGDVTFTEVKNEKNEIINLVAIITDITKRKNYETELDRLYKMALDANALTGLPGNNTIRKHIEDTLLKKEKKCLIYADLDNFKAYNDNYGFALGDRVIIHAANVFQDIANDLEIEDFFLGHIGGDDFVAIIPIDKVEVYKNLIIKKFEESIPNFYNVEDLKRGFIETHNREGNLQSYPFISISLAGLDLAKRGFVSYLNLNDALSIAKKQAKKQKGNSFFMD